MDEMNIHIPQSIQTVTELMLIANVDKRLVNPKNSQIAMKIKQDTLMGSYLQTYDSTRIDWKDCMNILMNTSVGLNGHIPKNKEIAGKYLYSQLIEPGINISRKNPDGSFAMQIKNGLITHGKFASSEIQSIVQKTWRQYTPKQTLNFIDDLQKMILQWLMIHGFTASIQDLVVPKKVHKMVYDIVETKRKEVLTAITEYENDPYVMSFEAFELSLEAGLASIQSNIDNAIMNALTLETGMNITIKSGSAGSASNAGQSIGCVGLMLVERARIKKKYNNRTLPMFHQFDDSAFARGFCQNSYLKGLSIGEYFFAIMAGREGVINTAIKTADKQQNRGFAYWVILLSL
jgi:DNA-directed RNA polymerase II subunit RPB1